MCRDFQLAGMRDIACGMRENIAASPSAMDYCGVSNLALVMAMLVVTRAS
jgi:hypothetical protein